MRLPWLRLRVCILYILPVLLTSLVLVSVIVILPANHKAWRTQRSRQSANIRAQMQVRNNALGEYDQATCSKIDNIAFLKIHKSGSTTISNILQRYAIRNHLNIVLPNKKTGTFRFNYIGANRDFTEESVIPIPKGSQYHILCNHVVYNRTMFRKLLPKGTFYFSIVRNPEARFVSAAFYYNLVSMLRRKVPGVNSTNYIFSEWLKNPWKYGATMECYNHVAHNFGIPRSRFGDVVFLEDYIDSLADDFNLVILQDYFDESLMLLRRRLCWSMRDMIYLRRNTGHFPVKHAFTEEDRKRLRKWQMADVAIFDRFHSEYWRQVEAEGRGLFLETQFFKNVLWRVSDYCSSGVNRWKEVHIESSTWSESFTVAKADCLLMQMDELRLVGALQHIAWARYNASVQHETEI